MGSGSGEALFDAYEYDQVNTGISSSGGGGAGGEGGEHHVLGVVDEDEEVEERELMNMSGSGRNRR